MKRTSTLLMVCLFAFASVSLQGQTAPHQNSSYIDLQSRQIKALSPEDTESLLKGEGMGFALAAELNHYPGPKHVLELQDKISLTDDQLKSVQDAFDRMHEQAVRLGEEIVEAERQLDSNFGSGVLDADSLEEAVTSIGTLCGQLRGVHLKAHLEMRELLTHQQIMSYVEARGYAHHQ